MAGPCGWRGWTRDQRTLALVGMGRSDKPTEKSDYSYPRHVRWLQALVQHADIRSGVFFGQDWGSVIGLKVVTLEDDRFDAIVLANGGLPDPDHPERIVEARGESEAVARDPERFQRWQQFSAAAAELHCGQMLSRNVEQFTGTPLSAEEAAAYDAPFPDPSYQASALIFPSLIRALGDEGEARAMMSAAWRVFERWEKPLLTANGKEDAVLGWADRLFQRHVPGAAGQPHLEFADGGHFIQEQYPDGLVAAIVGVTSRL